MKTRCVARAQAGLSKRVAASLLPWLVVAGCGGGGGGGDVAPFWVQTDVLVADLDGDHRADVVTLAMLVSNASTKTGKLTVHRQTSPGVFAAAETYSVGIYPWRMALADIDGDGAPDLVVTDVGDPAANTGQAVWLLPQDAGNRGHFTAARKLAINPVRPYDLAVGDLNGDGAPDIVVADSAGLGVGAALLLQDAGNRGNFLAPGLIALPGNAFKVALGDVDGDGLDDLVFRFSTGSDTESAIVYRQGDGSLSAATALGLTTLTGLNSQALAIADYDADDMADIVEFFSPASSSYQATLMTWRQAPVATFNPPTATSLADIQGTDGGVVADLDGDGKPDFASVGFYPVGSPTSVESTLNIFMQTGGGGFGLARSIDMPVSASRVAAGDIDGDGLNDLVVAGENQVLILLQAHASPGNFGSPLPVNPDVAIWN